MDSEDRVGVTHSLKSEQGTWGKRVALATLSVRQGNTIIIHLYCVQTLVIRGQNDNRKDLTQ